MRTFVLLALASVATLTVAAPKPASAEPKVLPVESQMAAKVEEVGIGTVGIATSIGPTIIDGTAITDRITDPTPITVRITDLTMATTDTRTTIGPTTTVRALAFGLPSEPKDR
jgi:hypothetical protein